MNNIEEAYKAQTVKIFSKDSAGSGCVFQPNNINYSYVFTAKHCLVDDDTTINTSEIIVRAPNYINEKDTLVIKQIYLHSLYDLAVIVINKIETLDNTLVYEPLKDAVVSIYGYPKQLDGYDESRENVLCNIAFRHKEYFELASEKIQFSFETSVPDNIEGLSGSGVYYENGNTLYFSGIFTKLKAIDGAYNKFCAFNASIIDEFITAIGLTSLYGDYIDKINNDSVLLKKVFYLPYKKTSDVYYLKRLVDQVVINHFSSTKHLWISGKSGVGKTNLIFRNLLFNDKEFIFIDLSTLNKSEVIEHFKYINQEIVDQCDIKEKITGGNIYDIIAKNINNIAVDSKPTIIFVDEVPILDIKKFYDFVTGFITISDKCFNQSSSDLTIKWVISTRIDPSLHIQRNEDCLPNKSKAYKNFNFKNLELWNYDDLFDLLKILQHALNFSLSKTTIDSAIAATSGYPGKLKDIIERVILERCSIEHAISLIKSETL